MTIAISPAKKEEDVNDNWLKKPLLKKLILHTQDGAIPYLSPYLLQTYFSPETNHLVKNHLIVGVTIKDTCVIPNFQNKQQLQVQNGNGISTITTTNKITSTPPTGYTFQAQPISIFNRLRILPGYTTLILPTFDLIDDYDWHQNNNTRNQTRMNKKRKQNDDDELMVRNHMDGNRQQNDDNVKIFINNNTYCTNNHVSLVTPHGIQKITPTQYLSIVSVDSLASSSSSTLSPVMTTTTNTSHDNPENNIHSKQSYHLVALFDQLYGNEGDKRRKLYIQRMIDWTCLLLKEKHVPSSTSSRNTLNTSDSIDGRVWIPLDVHLSTSEREYYVQSILQRHRHQQQEENKLYHPPCQFVLIGWHRMYCNNKIHTTTIRRSRRDCLREQITHLTSLLASSTLSNTMSEEFTSSIQTTILCTQDITQFIDAIRCGVDCIGSNIPQRYAQEGKALCLVTMDNEPVNITEEIQAWMDVTNPRYMRDRDPLIPGCRCLACKNRIHSRAYIYHLIQAHELLAEILLFGHNLHQMLLFLEQWTYMDSLEKIR